jgi:hypothetical protein
VGPRAGLDEAEKRKFLTLPGLELPIIIFFIFIVKDPERKRPLFSKQKN